MYNKHGVTSVMLTASNSMDDELQGSAILVNDVPTITDV